jgi:hypothetical protein
MVVVRGAKDMFVRRICCWRCHMRRLVLLGVYAFEDGTWNLESYGTGGAREPRFRCVEYLMFSAVAVIKLCPVMQGG